MDSFLGPDEWNTEEYTGSLADTKVFTPSVPPNLDIIESAPVGSGGLSIDNAVINTGPQIEQTLQGSQIPSQSPVQIGGTLNAAQTQYLNQLTQQNSDNIKQYGSAQAYHAQNSNQAYNPGTTVGSQSYNSNQQYAATNNYVNSSYSVTNNNYQNTTDQQPAQQPVRTKTQRARVPPPSKVCNLSVK